MKDILGKQKETARQYMRRHLIEMLSCVAMEIIIGGFALCMKDRVLAQRICYIALPVLALLTVCFGASFVKAFAVFRAVIGVSHHSTELREIVCDKVRFMTYMRGVHVHAARSVMIGVIFVDTEGQRFYYVFPENHWLANQPETCALYDKMCGQTVHLQCYRASHAVKRVDE